MDPKPLPRCELLACALNAAGGSQGSRQVNALQSHAGGPARQHDRSRFPIPNQTTGPTPVPSPRECHAGCSTWPLSMRLTVKASITLLLLLCRTPPSATQFCRTQVSEAGPCLQPSCCRSTEQPHIAVARRHTTKHVFTAKRGGGSSTPGNRPGKIWLNDRGGHAQRWVDPAAQLHGARGLLPTPPL